MPVINLYTKDGCTLCDYVKAYLETRADDFPHRLVEIDITQNHDVFMYYRYIIPVVEIGCTTLKAPITNAQLEAALQTQ